MTYQFRYIFATGKGHWLIWDGQISPLLMDRMEGRMVSVEWRNHA